MVKDEIFPLVNEQGEVMGQATRRECHSGSKLLHPVVHLHVRDAEGRLFLQKRSMTKDIQPGKWDTAVGGHIDFGETVNDALLREAREELGLTGFTPEPLFSYVHESDIEREFVNAFTAVVDESMIVIEEEEKTKPKRKAKDPDAPKTPRKPRAKAEPVTAIEQIKCPLC